MNFVQHNFDLDENFIADLIIRDKNMLNQDLNVNEIDFDFDEDSILDLIRGDENKSHSVELFPNYPAISQPFETEQFDDKGNRTLIFGHNESRTDSTYYHPHQTNVKQQAFTKYVKHTIPDELKTLSLKQIESGVSSL